MTNDVIKLNYLPNEMIYTIFSFIKPSLSNLINYHIINNDLISENIEKAVSIDDWYNITNDLADWSIKFDILGSKIKKFCTCDEKKEEK